MLFALVHAAARDDPENGVNVDDLALEEEAEEEGRWGSMESLVIILFLIFLTIFFEKIKHHAEHRAGTNMRPIVHALFGELTVLGFLSLVTYFLEKGGAFRAIASSGGDDGEESEEQFELFERIHFAMFLIMVVFIVQVLVEVEEGLVSQREWCQWDRASQDQVYVRDLLRQGAERDTEYERRGSANRVWRGVLPYFQFLPFLRDHEKETLEDKIEFCSLRSEFQAERSVDPPFKPAGETEGGPAKIVGQDFNFGRYLTACYTKKMEHVVEIDVGTWLFFAGVIACYFVIFSFIFGMHARQLANVWMITGWCMHILVIRFEQYLLGIRDRFLDPEFVPKQKRERLSWLNLADAATDRATETQPLNASSSHTASLSPQSSLSSRGNEHLPLWCQIDTEALDKRRSFLSKRILGPTPSNRQHALYFFGPHGPLFHLFCIRIALIFSCVYSAQLCIIFMPIVWDDEGTTWTGFVVYAVLSLMPALAFIFNKKRLISVLVQVGCMGVFTLPQAVSKAEREEKTAMAVRVLVMISKLSKLAKDFMANPDNFKMEVTYSGHYTSVFSAEEISELGRIFTKFFDEDQDGSMSGKEFQALMNLVGIEMDEIYANNLVHMVASSVNTAIHAIDTDEAQCEIGLRELSKEGFFQWYANQLARYDDKKQCATFLFKLFDEDDSGDITGMEFKHLLDKLQIGISSEESNQLLDELDEDGNGVLCTEEFEDLVERFYPAEFKHHANSTTVTYDLGDAKTFTPKYSVEALKD